MRKSKKIQTVWNLKNLYSSPLDSKIFKDIKEYESKCIQFEKKYKLKNNHLKNSQKLKTVLEEYELLTNSTLGSKPFVYLTLCKQSLPDKDGKVEGILNRVTEISIRSGNHILFFKLALGRISKKNQQNFLKDNALTDFHYYLKSLFDNAHHLLSEPEEKVLRLKVRPSSIMWTDGVEKQLNKLTVVFENKTMPLSEASNLLRTLPTQKRRSLYSIILSALETVSDFSESEINAICIDKKINDDLRGFKTPSESVILSFQNDPKVVSNLIETVTNSFPVAHRFYKIKSKMIKLSRLSYADRFAGAGNVKKKITFAEGLKTLHNVFSSLNPLYATILNRYINEGQIDVFPRKHKESGAFCWTLKGLPTHVLLNHAPDFDSLTTFAHEMGHAIHGELSKKQRLISQGHSMAVAEVASTLFEMFIFEELFKNLSPAEKIIALHDKIQDDIQTIFRQIACFNFEQDLHMQIREKGSLPKEEISRLMNKHMKSYLGPTFDLTQKDGLSFVSWSHIRRFFYVYSYAYGQLISKALFAEYTKDPLYLKKIEQFLSAGQSKSPEDIFESVGIPIRNKEFFKKGIQTIENDIDELERLLKKKK